MEATLIQITVLAFSLLDAVYWEFEKFGRITSDTFV